ncbi:hypothetical protein DL769_008712 [Monosporascus sp. CRB-8-3]|nr:hypothetical protein DL769_008712 [Monosporascus sp. CRB-8-3]
MDPFAITVGALGITGFASSSIVKLRDFINGLAEAKDLLQDIVSNLEGIERPLAALEKLSIPDEATSTAAQEDLKKTGVAEAVNKCGHACDNFAKNLKKWTQHSRTTKLSLRDRFSVGVWNKEKIRTFRIQVQSCEATVQFAVASTQLIVQLRSEKMTETDRKDFKKQLQSLETKIQEHLDLTRQQQDEARKRKQELREEPEDEEDGGAQRTLAIKEVEEQSCLLESDQVSCGVVLSQLRSKRTGQEIGNVVTTDDSKALVGLPESVVGKVNQWIKDVTTQRNSVVAVGVFDRTVDMRGFFKTS